MEVVYQKNQGLQTPAGSCMIEAEIREELSMLKTIFLDLDDTLLDFTGGEVHALSRTLREWDVEPTRAVLDRYHVINAAQWELLEEGILTRDQVLVRRFEILFGELGVDMPPRETCERYESYLAEEHDFLPGAVELLRELAPRYDLYLASNGAAAVQHRRLRDAGIEAYFQAILISEELEADKPSRAFFDACFDRIPGFSPETALIVGDSLTSDIRGGINAGIRTCWLRHPGRSARPDIMPDYEITTLDQLPDLLKSL